MGIPRTPPPLDGILSKHFDSEPFTPESLVFLNSAGPLDDKGRYLHWDKVQHLQPPEGMTNELWWARMKLARQAESKQVPLYDKLGKPFHYVKISQLEEALHWIERNAAGSISGSPIATDPGIKRTYLIRSLIEESINSSQLEGANTTRQVAKEMIRTERPPKDKSEQMILNNYHAMSFIRKMQDEELTPSMILELHRIVSNGTLDDPTKAGKLRSQSDQIYIEGVPGEVVHEPPPAHELQERLERLCDFANGQSSKEFVNPIIRAIILHFMLGYDHPFVDGNGRTARALFYWSVAKSGYWLLEYVTVSKILKSAPAKYAEAFLLTETDGNDLTYFLLHQVDVIQKSTEAFYIYLREKLSEIQAAEALLSSGGRLQSELNFRQLTLLKHALKHPGSTYTIKGHQNSNGVTYQTARDDLLKLSDKLGFLNQFKSGRTYVFVSPEDLESRLRNHGRRRLGSLKI